MHHVVGSLSSDTSVMMLLMHILNVVVLSFLNIRRIKQRWAPIIALTSFIRNVVIRNIAVIRMN